MMDVALKTHKETTFGWMLTIQDLVRACRARGARRRAARAAVIKAPAAPKPMRYLTPR